MHLYLLRRSPDMIEPALFLSPGEGTLALGIEQACPSSSVNLAEVLGPQSEKVKTRGLTEDQVLEQVFECDNIIVL